MNYYNELDPKAAAWLRELIKQKLIPNGHVDERSIVDVRGSDLAGYTQCHFFAGIGGWPLALRLAGWPENRRVWTGSCPCQPFSTAGKQAGFDDKRHLWPEFKRLIAECKPSVCFGEQVASPLGREWLAGVFSDLEDMGYAAAGADLCAAGVGAPHIRQRLYWVADSAQLGRRQGPENGRRCISRDAASKIWTRLANDRHALWVGNAINAGLEGHSWHGNYCDEPGRIEADTNGSTPTSSRPWDCFDIMHFTDGKKRRIEPRLVPLAHGIPARMVRLRGYGNAIVPQTAAEFIQAYLDVNAL